MAAFQFYHLLHTPLEKALPKLMEKMLATGARAVVLTASPEQSRLLSDALWNADPASFLAHGTQADPHPQHQPIYLTTTLENPNGATILVATGGARCEDVAGFEKLLDMFDGSDRQQLEAARTRWKAYKEAGHTLTYYRQQPGGGWKAE